MASACQASLERGISSRFHFDRPTPRSWTWLSGHIFPYGIIFPMMANTAHDAEDNASLPWDESQQGYLLDANLLEFETRVLEVIPGEAERKIVTLERTYFYPTGGGQDHDTGWLGAARVVEVRKPAEGAHLEHLVVGEISPGYVQARIDAERRQRHRQNHSAQHLLSACFQHLFNVPTLSARIKGDAPSTIDLGVQALSEESLQQAEELANRLIFQNLPLRTYFLSPQELAKVPLRNAPKVDEHIRVVEIEGVDYAPCGGTHCNATGEIGLLKILKSEHSRQGVRVHFTAGWTALETFQEVFRAANHTARQLGVAMQDLPQAIERQLAQLKVLQRQAEVWRRTALEFEVQRLLAGAQHTAGDLLVSAFLEERPVQDLRWLAQRLSEEAGAFALLASQERSKLSVVLAVPSQAMEGASAMLRRLLKPLGGNAGGDDHLAQGGLALEASDGAERFNQMAAQLRIWLG